MTVTPKHRLADAFDSSFWTLAAGVFLGLSFLPFSTYGLAYVALVPLLIRWSRQPLGWMLLRESYSVFLVTAAVAGHWVLFHENAVTALTSGLGLLLLPVPMALPILASALVRRRFGMIVGFIALVAFWLGMEYALSHGPLALPWLLLGNTQAAALPFNQFADIAGVGGLSLWLWLVNGALFAMLRVARLGSRLALGAVAVGLFAGPILYGQSRLPALETTAESFEVAVVQPGVAPRLWADVEDGGRVDLLAELSESRLASLEAGERRPSLIVWPETALPVYPDAQRQRRLYGRMRAWSLQHDIAVLTGAITRYESAPAPTVDAVVAKLYAEVTPYYNSAILFGSGRSQQYDKMHMIPFAERVPLVEWRPALAALGVASGGVSGYGLGRKRLVLEEGGARFGALICYESLFGEHAATLVKNGAQFLTVLSQDGWWGRSAGYLQHFDLTRLRAIETRRTVVMATVTGRSGVIGPDGRASETTGWMERTVRQASVPLLNETTFYVRHGDWVGRGALAVSLLITLAWIFIALFFPKWRVPTRRKKPTGSREMPRAMPPSREMKPVRSMRPVNT